MTNQQNCCISGENLNLLAVFAANILAKDLNVNEIAQLSTLLSVVGAALSTIAATRALCDNDIEPPIPFR